MILRLIKSNCEVYKGRNIQHSTHSGGEKKEPILDRHKHQDVILSQSISLYLLATKSYTLIMISSLFKAQGGLQKYFILCMQSCCRPVADLLEGRRFSPDIRVQRHSGAHQRSLLHCWVAPDAAWLAWM